MGGVAPFEPANLVDLLLDVETLEVIELWLVTLEGAVDVVLNVLQTIRGLRLEIIIIIIIIA